MYGLSSLLTSCKNLEREDKLRSARERAETIIRDKFGGENNYAVRVGESASKILGCNINDIICIGDINVFENGGWYDFYVIHHLISESDPIEKVFYDGRIGGLSKPYEFNLSIIAELEGVKKMLESII